MEVRPGYKQTEVGVIPEEWEVRQFSDHFRIYAGGDVPKHSLSKNQSPEHPYPIFANALSNSGLYGYTAERRSSGDSVTITARGYLGHAEYRSSPFFPIVRLLVLEPTGKLDAQFTAYAINEVVEFAVESTGVPQLTAPQVGRYCVAAPPTLEEQRAIAAALSDVDALLAGLDRLIAKKRDLKQAAMQQLLTGQTRLPGFHGEWEVKRLGDVGDIRSGGTPSTGQPHFWDGDVPWCTPTDITALLGHKYLTRTSRTISAAGLQASSAEVIPAHSLVMTSRATIGECAINLIPMTTNQGFKNIVPFAELDVEFLYYVMTTQKPGLIALCGGSTFLEIGKKQLSAYEITLPRGRAEQTAIATVLSDMDSEIEVLEARRAKTRALKQGMMQELLTGRTRLVEPTSRVVAVDCATHLKPAPTEKPANGLHNWQINEAVVVAMLVKNFGSEQYPLGRKRCTKLAYLMHRHVEHVAEGYLKKAAGPYNPAVKYKGPEGIAQKNGYIRVHRSGDFSGFVAAGNIARAEEYFDKWYGSHVLVWLEQFRHQSNDELELLTTVDMAVEDLKRINAKVGVETVKSVIRSHPEWEAKLERDVFADKNIARAVKRVVELFPAP